MTYSGEESSDQVKAYYNLSDLIPTSPFVAHNVGNTSISLYNVMFQGYSIPSETLDDSDTDSDYDGNNPNNPQLFTYYSSDSLELHPACPDLVTRMSRQLQASSPNNPNNPSDSLGNDPSSGGASSGVDGSDEGASININTNNPVKNQAFSQSYWNAYFNGAPAHSSIDSFPDGTVSALSRLSLRGCHMLPLTLQSNETVHLQVLSTPAVLLDQSTQVTALVLDTSIGRFSFPITTHVSRETYELFSQIQASQSDLDATSQLEHTIRTGLLILSIGFLIFYSLEQNGILVNLKLRPYHLLRHIPGFPDPLADPTGNPK